MAVEAVAGRRRPQEAPATASAAPARRPPRDGRRRRLHDQRGAVTAEAAVVLPVLLALALGAAWLVALAATKVRVVDGAREVARVAARGEEQGAAVASGKRVAPDGTRFTVRHDGERVVVRAVATVDGPGGLFGFLPAVTVESEAVAAEEPR